MPGAEESAAEGTTLAFAQKQSDLAEDRQRNAERLAENQIEHQGSILGGEEFASLAERADSIPVRLTERERDFLRLLEGTLMVSEYTDHVDVASNDYGFGWSFYGGGGGTVRKKENRMQTCLTEVFQLMLGLHLCFDFKQGQKRCKKAIDQHGEFFAKLFEIGRRFKIMNPDRMRTSYGKLVCILQDAGNPSVMNFQCNEPVETVASMLKRLDCLELLHENDLVERVCHVHDLRVMSIDQQKLLSAHRTEMIGKLRSKYVDGDGKLSEDELMLVLNSLSDGNAYVASCRHPVDKMINYLKRYFDPQHAPDELDSLSIQSGRGGSCLSHSHVTQYKFVMQSLQLWREIQNQMFRLWIAADADLQDQRNPYRLYNTGQGLHRVQRADRVSRIMHEILGTVKRRVGSGWVGLSVVHLGDRDVPNALVFIDKYTQVPRILAPIVLTLESIGVMCAENEQVGKHVKAEYDGVESLRKCILRDFFRHGFDGSGDDGGSCIDGRLTSAWNWCSRLEKKTYSHVFHLTGFSGFDGSFKV